MNNIQRMNVKVYNAMRRCVLQDIETYGYDDYITMLEMRGRRKEIIEIRRDCKARLKRTKFRDSRFLYKNLYEAARGERDWWNRRVKDVFADDK